jgi:hypothetical protein
LELLLQLKQQRPRTHFIAGNHDAAMLLFLLAWVDPTSDYSATRVGFVPRRGETLYGSAAWSTALGRGSSGWAREAARVAERMHLQGQRWATLSGEGMDSCFSARATFESYGVPFGDAPALLAALPATHLAFLQGLPLYLDLRLSFGRVLAVHAGLESGDLAAQLAKLAARDHSGAWLEPLCGRWNVVDAPEELAQDGCILASGHHGFVHVGEHRVIIDASGGDPRQRLAAAVLPGRYLVKDTLPEGP